MEDAITIHRGLSELKLLDSKIEKKIGGFLPCGIKQSNGLVNKDTDAKEFDKNATSGFESINGLIKRKQDIKKAIVKANAETNVTIAGVKMSIADAITYKAFVEVKRRLIAHLKSQLDYYKSQVSQSNDIIDANALKLTEAAFGKDNVEIKDTDIASIMDPYKAKNTYSLVDPLKIGDKIEELTKEVDDFEAEVDAVLSEANSLTKLDIKA